MPPLPEKSAVQKYQMSTDFIDQRRRALQVGRCHSGIGTAWRGAGVGDQRFQQGLSGAARSHTQHWRSCCIGSQPPCASIAAGAPFPALSSASATAFTHPVPGWLDAGAVLASSTRWCPPRCPAPPRLASQVFVTRVACHPVLKDSRELNTFLQVGGKKDSDCGTEYEGARALMQPVPTKYQPSRQHVRFSGCRRTRRRGCSRSPSGRRRRRRSTDR